MLSQIWITWRSLDEKYTSIYLKETNKFQPNSFETSWQGIMKILKAYQVYDPKCKKIIKLAKIKILMSFHVWALKQFH
jgi:hypothetical protein